MNDEEKFLQAMCDNLADPYLPLVFADWLEERGSWDGGSGCRAAFRSGFTPGDRSYTVCG